MTGDDADAGEGPLRLPRAGACRRRDAARAANGPRIAALEIGGWDTHVAQVPRLKRVLEQLDAGLAALKEGLGDAWRQTAVLAMTEFGRTARVNGTKGTDHGTGTVAFVLGGAVAGGRVRRRIGPASVPAGCWRIATWSRPRICGRSPRDCWRSISALVPAPSLGRRLPRQAITAQATQRADPRLTD